MTKQEIIEEYWEEFLRYWKGELAIDTNSSVNIKQVVGFIINDYNFPTLKGAFWAWYYLNKMKGKD